MDDEVKRLLLQNLELARENNRLLRSLKRAQIWRSIISAIYWLVIILVPLYLYYAYVAPYLIELRKTYDTIEAQSAQMQNMPEGWQQYMESLKKLLPKGEE